MATALQQQVSSALELPSDLSCYRCKLVRRCKRCTSCNNAFYCGRECQRAHWSVHKPKCQELQEIKRWSSFVQHLGGQFTHSDDETYAHASMASMPMLHHLVLGNLEIGNQPGQVYLKIWRFGPGSGSVPIYVMTDDFKNIETDTQAILRAFNQLLGSYTLEEAIRNSLPVAIKRTRLFDIGFKLPSAIHSRKGGLAAKEPWLFVEPRKV